MMKPALDPKTPADVKDYGIDWAPAINDTAVTIVTSTWEIITAIGSPDLTKDATTIEGQIALVRLSGGQEGFDYVLENTITTSAGETLVDAIEVRIKSATDAAGIY